MTLALALALCSMAHGYAPACARARVVAPIIMAEHRDLDPLLVGAVAFRESSWRPDAVSRRGALGLMQIMPATAARRCPDLRMRQPRDSVRCAVRILRRARERCPEWFLSLYHGEGCGPSRYAARIAEVIHGIFQETVTGDY